MPGTLDELLGVAFRAGHVIEVTGEAGAGKSQILLNALSMSVRGCKDAKDRSIAVSTEGAFPAERLQQMIASCHSRYILHRSTYVKVGVKNSSQERLLFPLQAKSDSSHRCHGSNPRSKLDQSGSNTLSSCQIKKIFLKYILAHVLYRTTFTSV